MPPCLAVCGVVVVGEGWLRSQTAATSPAGSRPTGGGVSLRRLYSLPQPTPTSGSVLFRPKIQNLQSTIMGSGSFWFQMVPPPTRAHKANNRALTKAPTRSPRKASTFQSNGIRGGFRFYVNLLLVASALLLSSSV